MPGDKLRGEQPVRVQYGYKINEAKILPSKLLGIPAELWGWVQILVPISVQQKQDVVQPKLSEH